VLKQTHFTPPPTLHCPHPSHDAFDVPGSMRSRRVCGGTPPLGPNRIIALRPALDHPSGCRAGERGANLVSQICSFSVCVLPTPETPQCYQAWLKSSGGPTFSSSERSHHHTVRVPPCKLSGGSRRVAFSRGRNSWVPLCTQSRRVLGITLPDCNPACAFSLSLPHTHAHTYTHAVFNKTHTHTDIKHTYTHTQSITHAHTHTHTHTHT
jgi:hypothetical protein